MKYYGINVEENEREIENDLCDILTEYAVKEIFEENTPRIKQKSEEYKIKNKINNIMIYAAYNIKKDVIKQREGSRRYDWDTITHKDDKANLLNHIANYLLSEDEITKKIESIKILSTIKENIFKYFEEDFEIKVEDEKNHYELNSKRDYFYEE